MLLLRWARQVAQALLFCHNNSVLHGDINCSNLFIDRELNIKLGDLAGSSIDDFPATVCYSTTHEPPASDSSHNVYGNIVTKETEVFALGFTLYEMVTGHPPFHDKFDSEVECLFRAREFPDVGDLAILGPVIKKCWNVEFNSMQEVLYSIERYNDQARPPNTLLQSFTLSLKAKLHFLFSRMFTYLKQLKYRLFSNWSVHLDSFFRVSYRILDMIRPAWKTRTAIGSD